jgi:hypothetical protein
MIMTTVTVPVMTELHTTVLNRAMKLLDALPVVYAIRLPDGTLHGALPVAPPVEPERPRRRRVVKNPMGTFSRRFDARFSTVAVGDVISIRYEDVPELPPKRVSGAFTSWAGVRWGKGSYVSQMTDTGVDLLRVA